MPELVNVPDVDGVPAVLFAPGAGTSIALAIGDAAGIPFPILGAPQWGLYRNGAPVVACDTVLAFDHKADWSVADYPVEKGRFESFNKVQIPYDVRLVFLAGGSEASRSALLSSLQAIAGDLNIYDAVTPETVYPRVNVIHLDYRRSREAGVGMLAVNVFCQEVRAATASASDPSATGQVGTPASADAADQVNDGTVQAQDLGSQPNATATLSDGTPNTTATDLGMTPNAPVTTLPIDGTTVAGSVTLPEISVTAPQTSSSISGLEAAGPDQYNVFGTAP